MIIRHTVHMCRTLESARSLVRPWWMENCSTLISNVVDHYKAICHFGRALVAVLEFQKVLFLEAWECMGCQWADYKVNHWVCHLCLRKKKIMLDDKLCMSWTKLQLRFHSQKCCSIFLLNTILSFLYAWDPNCKFRSAHKVHVRHKP